jgi:hypothetical protein
MNRDTAARKILILDLMDAFLASPTDGQITAYIKATAAFDTEALARAVARFREGTVPWFDESRYGPPKPPDFAREVALHHRVIHRGETNVIALAKPEHGHISVDHGFGRISLVGLTRAEVETVDEWKGRTPDGRNMAGMSIEAIKEAINQPVLALDKPRSMKAKIASLGVAVEP